MIKPINSQILIEPVKHESFMYSERETYEEIGIVLDAPEWSELKIGSKVFFDSWLAAKYPKDDSKTEFYWLVPYDSIKAYDDEPLSA